jgi:hypothetical protein
MFNSCPQLKNKDLKPFSLYLFERFHYSFGLARGVRF